MTQDKSCSYVIVNVGPWQFFSREWRLFWYQQFYGVMFLVAAVLPPLRSFANVSTLRIVC